MKTELEIIEKVKENLKSDRDSSPFFTDKWYKKFTKMNEDGISIKEAPLNVVLMVVSHSLGTFYKNDRGNSIIQGSILVKVSDTKIHCIDAESWYAIPPAGHIYSNNGYFEIDPDKVLGKVKEVEKVKV